MCDVVARIQGYIAREIERSRKDVVDFRAAGQEYAAAFCRGIEFGLAPIARLIEEADVSIAQQVDRILSECWQSNESPDETVELLKVLRKHSYVICPNCDGRKCMGCVFREYDHDCTRDCPTCC